MIAKIPANTHSASRPNVSYGLATLGVIGMIASLSGDEMLRVVVVIASSQHEVSVLLGLFAFFCAVPAVFAPIAGLVIDKFHYSPEPVFNAAGLSAIAGSAFLWASWNTAWSDVSIYAGGFLVEAAALVTAMAWQSYVPEFAAEGSAAARQHIGRTATALMVGPLLGPVIVALTVSSVPVRTLVLAELVGTTLAIVLVQPALRRLGHIRRAAQEAEHHKHMPFSWRSLGQGIRLVLNSRVVRIPLFVLSLSNGVSYAVFFALPVLVYARTGSPSLAASATTVELVCGLIGSLLGARFNTDRNFVRYVVAEPILRALGLIIIAISHDFTLLLLGTAVFALPQGVGRIARAWMLSQAFSAGERGRANGGYRFIARALMPLLPVILASSLQADSVVYVMWAGVLILSFASTLPASSKRFHKAVREQISLADRPK